MFALRLKELREKTGLSQKAFAIKLGVSQSTVAMWESQRREPNFKKIEEIAKFFNTTTDYLLGRTDEPGTKSLDEQLKGIDFALYGETKDLDDAQKQDVLRFIRFLKSKDEG